MTANNNIEDSNQQKNNKPYVRRWIIGGGSIVGIVFFIISKEIVFITIWNAINSWPVVILLVALSVCVTYYKVTYENNVTEREKNDIEKLKKENQDLKEENVDLKKRTEKLGIELCDKKSKSNKSLKDRNKKIIWKTQADKPE